ncbi:hypothetical protein ACWEF9_24870 [Streptomyces sp. NPDC004980]
MASRTRCSPRTVLEFDTQAGAPNGRPGEQWSPGRRAGLRPPAAATQ